jgi:hypothetical protein
MIGHAHTDTRSMPIVCLSVQNQAKKRNLQTGYIDVEWTMIFKYKKEKYDLYKKKKQKHSWGSHTKTKTNRQVSSLKKNTPD